MQRRRIHKLLEASLLLKGAHAVIECVGGLALALTSTAAISRLVNGLNPHLPTLARGFSVEAKHFYAFYLVSHGVVQLLLVICLLRGKLWAYPASLAVMGLFVVYQIYRYSYTHGVGLIALTIFDILVIGLIWQEYRLVRQKMPAG